MRRGLHIIPLFIHDSLHSHRDIGTVRLHDLNALPDRKLIALFNPVESLFVPLSDNAQIRVLLHIGVIVVNLRFVRRFAKEKSSRKLPVGAV